MKTFFSIIFLYSTIINITAQSKIDLLSVQELEHQRLEAAKEIELTSQLLNETSADARNSLNRLNLLTQQLIARTKVITLLGQEIASIDRKIDAMTKEIEILDKDLITTKENYAKSMANQQSEYRTAQHKMIIILSAENFTQTYRRMRYLREYSDWQKTEAVRILKKQDEVTRRKTELETSRKSKQTLLTEREDENRKLLSEEQDQKTTVNELNKRKKTLQQQLQQKIRESDALNRQIDALITDDIHISEKNSSTSASTATNKSKSTSTPATASSTKGNYIMTEAELNLSKDFASNKGRLPYPITGNRRIVSHFGNHQHQQLSHVRTNNNGIDIQTTVGAEARVIFKGVVTRIFLMPGFNSSVIVRHGNYLTVYSNLMQVYVRAGDAVLTNQAIGKIYTDAANSNETILHFQIWKERTKLDPEPWIKSY
ncbi:MAG: peptidoglycan DD-metalloendopeptidase family protein [Tannerella sp.]|jgi:septal ring factor EnvC (AmiA/AmiB activator)|nr:peptidoglycan DD-metalloendopeptidase family protein [Tannerella sp.]